MAKTKPNAPTTLPDDADTLSIRFYISDAASGKKPRVSVEFPNVIFDHAVEEYSSLTAQQKSNLRAMLLALRDETFTLEGFS